ncbi:MAG TPA: hypothetical protein VGH24_00325 [Solirubrobacteraceae bacterium]
MTPSAMTAAGRSTAPRPVQAPGVPGHRRGTRPATAPSRPRRVSGPAPGRRAAPSVAGRNPSLAARGLLVIRGLPEHTLLDRIVRGRAWIPLLGVLLVGIVAMQVEILKLGTGMGRWIERSSTLSIRNQALQASVAGLMDDQRIEGLAGRMGMVMPDAASVSFLSAQSPGDASRAVANIHAPDPSGFDSQLSALAASSASASGALGSSTQSAVSSSSATGVTDTSSSSSSTASSASSTAAVTSTAPASSTSSAQPVDAGGSSGGSQSSGSGSGGAASIAPPSASQSAATSGG